MKKSGVLLRALVISALMVMNGQSAVLFGNRPLSEIYRDQNFYQKGMEKIFDAVANECIPGTWTGVTDSEWNTATNWCDGLVPTYTTNVIIPNVTNQPFINSAAFCNHLTILTGAKLTISDFKILTVSGNLVNNGYFYTNKSTVIFNGDDQEIGFGPYNNITFRGEGKKTIHNVAGKKFYSGILSMEDLATVSELPDYSTTSRLQYNSLNNITTGLEWPQVYTSSITIMNTGVITINNSKNLLNSSGGRGSLIIDENATLNLNTFIIQNPGTVHLKCGGLSKGSSIIGTGKLYIDNTQINVTDAGNGTAGAMVTCTVDFSGTNVFNIANDDPNKFTDDDLTINMSSNGYQLNKSGTGTLNTGSSNLSLYNLKIDQGNIIIPVGAKIGVIYETTISQATGLIIKSDASGTGSLITTASSGSGTAKVERYMTPGAWHIVSCPVTGQLISNFLASNISIPTDEDINRGMRDYNPGLNLWNDFFTNETSGVLTTGKGYCMRVRTSQAHKVNFTGTLQAGELIISDLIADKWNCIGNPYTSAIKINSEIAASAFLGVNSTNLDPSFGAIYIWDQKDESNGIADKYTIVSNATSAFEIQLGQAFMVKMATGKTSVNFKKVMQLHNSTLALKSTGNIWPTIKLLATADSITSSTIVAFHEGMTPGLDPTYDAGLLKGGASVEVYTRLVEDNGIPFDIQALPADYASTVVPVGIDCTKGGQVNLSAELMHVPSSCQVLLEDRLNNILTDLSVNSYTADLKGNTSSQDRFYLHTSYSTTGIDPQNRIQNLRAWVVNNQEMRISGQVESMAKAKLFDIQGRCVLSESLKSGLYNIIKLPDIKPGIYILHVDEIQHNQILKVFVSN